MSDILIRSGCFIAIIVLGYTLRRIGLFKAEDFNVLSNIVLKITLPAAVVSNMAGRELEFSMLSISLLGLGFGALYILLGFLSNLGADKERRAFEMLNLPGYNIGCFALPFLQSFLGPAGVTTAILMDTGNSLVCLGGAYSAAAMVKEGKGASLKQALLRPLKSVPFVTYIIMTALTLLRLTPPSPVLTFADIISNANVFLSMLMIGVGFRLSAEAKQLMAVARMLLLRFGLAAILAAGCYFLLPLGLEYRKALAILVFSPISGATPAFTAALKEDVGLSSAINSFSILISIPAMIGMLMLVQ